MDGKLALCPYSGCKYRCCDSKQVGYIYMYPGEVEEARQRGESVEHLEVIDPDFHGGRKVKCRANETKTCDHGYKPLDCSSYPFFPRPHSGATDSLTSISLSKGSACPLMSEDLVGHAKFVSDAWLALMRRTPQTADWLEGVWRAQHTDPEAYL
jgi:hypothetical protein